MNITSHQKAEVLATARPNRRVHDDGTSEPMKRTLERGSFDRRIVAEKTFPLTAYTGREVAFHATKGWRARRVAL